MSLWRSWHARAAVPAAAVSRWTAPTAKRPPTAARFCSDSIRMHRCVFRTKIRRFRRCTASIWMSRARTERRSCCIATISPGRCRRIRDKSRFCNPVGRAALSPPHLAEFLSHNGKNTQNKQKKTLYQLDTASFLRYSIFCAQIMEISDPLLLFSG